MDLSVISRTGGPALFWRGPDHDRLDLTGPVIANWVNKGVGLFGDYGLDEDFTLLLPLPNGLHWRELVAILSVLLAGGRVVIGHEAPGDDFHAFVPLGSEGDDRLGDAEEIFVYNPPALALSTPVDEGFIDVNSAIRAYPDVTPRRLGATGTLTVGTEDVPWTHAEAAPGNTGTPADEAGRSGAASRPQGILVSRSTPRAHEWSRLLPHLLGGGEVLLTTEADEDRIADLAAELGEVRGRLGSWTK
ncbi:hypothetical protein DFO66_10377 [Brevibacterium sanguinis]|uniref:TIGR03089 family protein n=2 Tax=Brevibacterium TaxID=1696 RepID=A0A366IMI3_9MICO|nr:MULTISPECIES: hypothetical protein [Brevibacterium]RBP66134.1 hypothetical protein DFO66_10377 [Brevibacterium sanguinis]RBP72785.1 hypothetical protein DFO65_10376 [Brevibacterium celere]